jgi:hypothetical protein
VKPNGQLVSLALTNLGTFVGAVCFLVGGVLLLPERTSGPPDGQLASDEPGHGISREFRTNAIDAPLPTPSSRWRFPLRLR